MSDLKAITEKIRRFNNFLITSHVNLEGDSLGSQLAMANLLKCMGKNSTILDSDAVPARYRFLPDAGLVKNKLGKKERKFEAAIVLDCPNIGRTGRVKNVVKKIDYVINIDHHISNEKFGDINWIDKEASSAGEMIFKLYNETGCEITPPTALYLYTAILTDTGSFNYSNTSAATHEIVSELLGYGIKPYEVSKNVYENKTEGEIKLLGRILSGIRVTSGGCIAYAAAGKNDFMLTGTQPSSCENAVNFARSIDGVKVAVFFREDIKKKNVFHVSFRSTKEADVNKIASFFGGGGHRNASGCTVMGSFDSVKNKVLNKVKNALRQ
ncbi:MAG: bifunctional oligoribonuclease/PAP phosphatase NrnA [Candidatus Omnitrophica bacterium]|nr:bifunctional oligoribonuclease/PAP phosphatase NrnA [Candidatus Omnitrophota bacterium]